MGFSTSPLYPDSGTADALKINGTPVSGAKPANGQTLVYSSSIDEYVPQTPSGGGGTPSAHASTHATGGGDPITPAAIGAATAAQGAKADTALQPGTAIANISGLQTALDGKAATNHTHPLSQLEQSSATNGQVATWNGTAWVPQTPASGANFQPNPELYADNIANAVVSGGAVSFVGTFLKETQWFGTFYNYGGFYTVLGGFALVFNGTTFQASVANRWALIGDDGEGGYTAYAIANETGGAYPWSVTYNNGYVVTKTSAPRLVGTQLATTATEGTSSYAARADHVHPFPTALQVGAAPIQGGKIPSQYLPSYVDDVVEYASLAALQSDTSARESGKIYVTRDTGKIYRWSGSAMVEISPSPGSTDAVPEGSTNLYHTTARASAAAPVQSVAGRTGTVTLAKGDVGLGNVDNTSDANKPISTATQTALDGKAATSHGHAARDITSGTLPIERGGTGATTAEAARTALGATISPQIDRFVANGTWTKPAGAKQCIFEVVAGGGGGGRGILVAAGTAVSGGAGGGSGGYTRTLINAADLTDATYTITVGSGGIRGTFPSGGAGAGTSSTVSGATLGIIANANGGSGGNAGVSGATNSGAGAGLPLGNVGGAGSITANGGNGTGANSSCSSGGAGGGCSTTTPFNGGSSGTTGNTSQQAAGGNASTTGNGANGGTTTPRALPSLVINGSGGGGGGATTFAGASGGNGGNASGFGGGGGGGGSVSAASGTGGNGGAGSGGIVMITTYF